VKASIATVAVLIAVFGSAYGSVQWLDSRYAPLQAVQDLAWSNLKRELRDIREKIVEAQSDALRRRLELDLQDTLDRLCRSYPEDRECAR
jgi:hypothetical protein